MTVRARVGSLLALACALVMLYPVLASPVTADDQFWYLQTAAGADGSVPGLIQLIIDKIPHRLSAGRVNFVTELERRGAGLAVMEAAVATSTPVPVVQAMLKLALVAGGIACVLAFLRSLRWRAADGRLVRVSRRTRTMAAVAGTLAVAAGTQAHRAFFNGWTAYPVSTYGAVISSFGAVALLLWLTRLLAERRLHTAVVVGVLVLLGVLTAFRYELVFPSVPIAILTMAVVPVTDRMHRADGRRAKMITGAAFAGSFLPVLVATRIFLAGRCADGGCYSGVELNLGWEAVQTSALNIVSAIPILNGDEQLFDLAQVGWADRYPVWPTWWSVVVAVGVVVAMAAVWWSRRPAEAGDSLAFAGGEADGRAHVMLLLVGAAVSAAVAVASAVVMGVATRSHELVTAPGNPFRNTMVTWTGLAFCLVLLVLAAAGRWRGRPATAAWTSLGVLVAIAATFMLPANLTLSRVNRITHQVSDAVIWEVVLGDTAEAADQRRCALYEQIDIHVAPYAREHMKLHANEAFQVYHGQPFCRRG